MIYNYFFRKNLNYKCNLCNYSIDSKEEFCNHIKLKHKILLPYDSVIKNNIINALNVNFKNKVSEEKLCVICLDNEKTTAFFRCGHKVCCHECAKNILKNNDPEQKKCPVCRKVVGGILRIYD